MSGGDNTSLLIWTGGDCAGPPGYGYGGWSWLSVQPGGARGATGGERHTSAGRMRLRAVVEALRAAADTPLAPLQLDPGAPDLARLGAELPQLQARGWRTAAGEPLDDADLWGEIAAMVAARRAPVRFAPALPLAGADPRTFVAAWTEFARDRCKARGAFTAAIPKPNLASFLAKRGSP